jgi:hypothetical protein
MSIFSSRIDRIAAVRDRGDVERGVPVGERIEARVVAKRAFEQLLVRIDVALDDDFRIRWHLHVDRAALHELDPAAVEEAGEQQLFDARRQGGGGGVGHHALAAERDREGHLLAELLVLAEVTGAVVVQVPVHGGESGAEELHAVHADVSLVCFGVARVDASERDVAAGAGLGTRGPADRR